MSLQQMSTDYTLQTFFEEVEHIRSELDLLENTFMYYFASDCQSINKFWENYYGVINLSSKRLSLDELSVLGNGLKYCPTPLFVDHGLLKESIDRFFRTCSLKVFFHGIQSDPIENKPFEHADMKPKSKFNPPMPNNLDYVYNLVLDEILNYNPPKMKKTKNNLSMKKRDCLKTLGNDPRLVIKKADKGTNVVVMDRKDYIKEAHRQLKNASHYMPLTENLTTKYRTKVVNLIDSMFEQEEISLKTYRYLMEGGNRTPIFYMLPKIHKKKNPPPGRPIVSSCDCPTEKISQLTDIVLRPFAQKGKSFIKDTPDFIEKIKDLRLNENEWLVSMDVTNLYTNIPHHEGIRVVSETIKQRGNELPSNEMIIKMLSLILKCNCFKFNRNYFLQINGTAMGTRVAPTYAIIFMNWFEEEFVYTYKQKPRIWFRFIDDIWCIFKGSETDLLNFLNYLNNVHCSIKFTWEYSKKNIVFLDLQTFVENGNILTTLYEKPTNNHGYLSYDSCHPENTKNSIPYSQFLRIRRNCSKWHDFAINAIRLYIYLSLRGYPFTIINTALTSVNKMKREETLKTTYNSKECTEKLICVVDFNPRNPDIKRILLKYWPLLERRSSTRMLVDLPIMIAYRKPKSLIDTLCCADLPTLKRVKTKNISCNKPGKCKICPLFVKKGKIKSKSTSRKYQCLKGICCKSSNLIYCIECQICGMQYVGQTKNQIRYRLYNHISTIKNMSDTPVARHFNKHNEKIQPSLKVYILQLMRSGPDDDTSRLKWENIWIARLHSVSPGGMNILD